jgi:hypothetical protein
MNDENPTYVELEVLVPAAHVCFAYSSTDRRNWSTRWHIRRRTDEIGQLTGTFVDGQTKLVNSLAHSLTDRRNWSTHWHIRRRTDELVNSLAHLSTDRRNWSTHWHIRRLSLNIQ